MLEAIANSQHPLSATEIAKYAKVNRSTSWRLLNTLEDFNYIKKNELTNLYSLSLGIWRLSQNMNLNQLVSKSRPVLEKIVKRTKGTAFLEIPVKGELVVIDECKSDNPIQVDLAGIKVPLHCGSVGKLYLSSLPDIELEKFLDNKLESYTDFTITKKDILRKQIQKIKKTGIAFNFKEHNEQWCGITSVVLDQSNRHFAYLNLTLPTYLISEKELYSLKDLMYSSARDLEKKLK